MGETSTENSTTVSDYVGGGLWITVYCIIIVCAIAGNTLTLFAIAASRQLSSMVSNQFIFSLGVSDLLVGLSIPYHMCFYLTDSIIHNETTCLARFVLISFACASSILNLLFVATDRYTAIVHPLKYNQYMTRQNATFLISLVWILSLTFSTVPIYWNTWTEEKTCDVQIIPEVYFNFVLTPMFVLIWGVMLLVYIKIWREASKHAKRIRSTTNLHKCHNINDTKSIQVVMLTLGCFSICWMPYFIVTTYFRISGSSSQFSLLYEIAFTLAVCNSGMNPVIYAWKNSNFREAFWCLLTCHSPNNSTKKTNYITNHVPSSKKSSIGGHDNVVAQTEIEIESPTPKDYDEHECSVSTEMTTVNTSTWS
ncbi:Dopamine receptor 1-like Protein [Tribolium castaneum]|nr:Dopamine receptor 1-like Protein [Tribolium castaneum]